MNTFEYIKKIHKKWKEVYIDCYVEWIDNEFYNFENHEVIYKENRAKIFIDKKEVNIILKSGEKVIKGKGSKGLKFYGKKIL